MNIKIKLTYHSDIYISTSEYTSLGRFHRLPVASPLSSWA